MEVREVVMRDIREGVVEATERGTAAGRSTTRKTVGIGMEGQSLATAGTEIHTAAGEDSRHNNNSLRRGIGTAEAQGGSM